MPDSHAEAQNEDLSAVIMAPPGATGDADSGSETGTVIPQCMTGGALIRANDFYYPELVLLPPPTQCSNNQFRHFWHHTGDESDANSDPDFQPSVAPEPNTDEAVGARPVRVLRRRGRLAILDSMDVESSSSEVSPAVQESASEIATPDPVASPVADAVCEDTGAGSMSSFVGTATVSETGVGAGIKSDSATLEPVPTSADEQASGRKPEATPTTGRGRSRRATLRGQALPAVAKPETKGEAQSAAPELVVSAQSESGEPSPQRKEGTTSEPTPEPVHGSVVRREPVATSRRRSRRNTRRGQTDELGVLDSAAVGVDSGSGAMVGGVAVVESVEVKPLVEAEAEPEHVEPV
jgi:hypothetical protein